MSKAKFLDAAGSEAAQKVEQAARETARRPELRWLSTLGYIAKGTVYILIGWLAALAALGQGGTTTDRKGALQAIYGEPAGKFLLALLALGLVAHALFSFSRGALDLENKGSEPKGIAVRLFYAGVGVSYLALAWGALKLVLGSNDAGKSSDTSAQDWTAQLLNKPFGVALVVIAGLVVLGVAVYLLYRAYSAKFQKQLDLSRMNSETREWVVRFGQAGEGARGIVFAVIGIFLIVAALHQDPGEAKGLGGALAELAQQPYGPVLLGGVALGLMAFGLYSLAEGRYHKFTRH